MAPSEQLLMSRARAGCRRAFEKLWAVNEANVRAVVARMSPASVVDDVVQDVALGALSGITALRAEGDFRAWLLSIARHRAASARQRLRRQWAQEDAQRSVDSVTSDDAYERRRVDRHDVLQLLRRLPRTYRLPLWLRFVNGCSASEIAARMRTTQGSVRVALCRGLRRLRAFAGQRREDGSRPCGAM